MLIILDYHAVTWVSHILPVSPWKQNPAPAPLTDSQWLNRFYHLLSRDSSGYIDQMSQDVEIIAKKFLSVSPHRETASIFGRCQLLCLPSVPRQQSSRIFSMQQTFGPCRRTLTTRSHSITFPYPSEHHVPLAANITDLSQVLPLSLVHPSSVPIPS